MRGTLALGISGSTVVGYYKDAADLEHGHVFDGATYTTLDDPLGVRGTLLYATDGTRIVGSYHDASFHSHGLYYDGTTFTTIDIPGSLSTNVNGIWGNTLIGVYSDATGTHGYITSIPEPTGFALAVIGMLLTFAARCRSRRTKC